MFVVSILKHDHLLHECHSHLPKTVHTTDLFSQCNLYRMDTGVTHAKISHRGSSITSKFPRSRLPRRTRPGASSGGHGGLDFTSEGNAFHLGTF